MSGYYVKAAQVGSPQQLYISSSAGFILQGIGRPASKLRRSEPAPGWGHVAGVSPRGTLGGWVGGGSVALPGWRSHSTRPKWSQPQDVEGPNVPPHAGRSGSYALCSLNRGANRVVLIMPHAPCPMSYALIRWRRSWGAKPSSCPRCGWPPSRRSSTTCRRAPGPKFRRWARTQNAVKIRAGYTNPYRASPQEYISISD